MERILKQLEEISDGSKEAELLAALRTLLGALAAKGTKSETKKSLEQLVKLVKVVTSRLSKLMGAPSTAENAGLARLLFAVGVLGLSAFDRLKPVLVLDPFAIEKYWLLLLGEVTNLSMFSGALEICGRLRESLSTFTSAGPSRCSDDGAVKVVSSMLYHEAVCLLSAHGVTGRTLTAFKELLAWLERLRDVDDAKAIQFSRKAFDVIQSCTSKSTGRPGDCELAQRSFKLLAFSARGKPADFFGRVCLGKNEDAEASAAVAAMAVTVARRAGFIPPESREEFAEFCIRCSSVLSGSSDQRNIDQAKQLLFDCVDFLRERGDAAHHRGLVRLSLARVCICGGREAALLAQAEVQIGCAVDEIEKDLKQYDYSLLYRVTKALDDAKRTGVHLWAPFKKGGLVVPRELLKAFGRALVMLARTITEGLALEAAGKSSETSKQRFAAVKNFRIDALQYAMQAFDSSGATEEVTALLKEPETQLAMSVERADGRDDLRQLSGAFYAHGASCYNDKRYEAALPSLMKCCELLELCLEEDPKHSSNLAKKYELVAACHQRAKNPRLCLEALSRSVSAAIREKTPVAPSVIQRFVQVSTESFPEDPGVEDLLLCEADGKGADVETIFKVADQQLSVLQARRSPVSHRLALVDSLIRRIASRSPVHHAKALVEKAKLIRVERRQETSPCELLSKAIGLLKDATVDGKANALDDLATAYSWLGITSLESRRPETPLNEKEVGAEELEKMRSDTSDALRSMHVALGIWSKLCESKSSPSSTSTLQALQCTSDLLSLVGDAASQVNACLIAERVAGMFSDRENPLAEEVAITAITSSRLSLARAYASMRLFGPAGEVLQRAEHGIHDSQKRLCSREADSDAADGSHEKKLCERLQALVACGRLALLAAKDANEEGDDEEAALRDVERHLKNLQDPQTWEDFALVGELEYACAEALFHAGQGGRAIDHAISALYSRHKVAGVLLPGAALSEKATAAQKTLQQVHFRALFTEWRLLEGLTESFLQVGWMHELRESPAEAFYHYDRGVTIGLTLHVPKVLWTFLQELGELQYRRGGLEASAGFFEKANLLVGEGGGSACDRALSLMRLGDLQRRVGKASQAKQLYSDALSLCLSPSVDAPGLGETAIEVVAGRGDQTPREARILGLAARSKRTGQAKAKKSSPKVDAPSGRAPLESLAARIEGKLARIAESAGDIKQAEKLFSSALLRRTSAVVRGGLHMRQAQMTAKLANSASAAQQELLSTAEKEARAAYEAAVSCGLPSLLRGAGLAITLSSIPACSLTCRGDPWEAAFFLNASLGVPICQQASLLEGHGKRARRCKDEGRTDEICVEDLGEKLAEMDLGEAGTTSIFDLNSSHNRKEFRRRYVDRLPERWTVVSIAAVDDLKSLLICRLQPRRPPVLQHVRPNPGVAAMLEEFRALMKENKETAVLGSGGKEYTREQKHAWWASRGALDARIREMFGRLEDSLFGWRKALLLGRCAEEPVQKCLEERATEFAKKMWKKPTEDQLAILEAIFSGLPFMEKAQVRQCATFLLGRNEQSEEEGEEDTDASANAKELRALWKKAIEDATERSRGKPDRDPAAWGKERDRHPVILVLDRTVQELPWESMPCLSTFTVSRVPSIAFAASLSRASSRKGEIFQVGANWSKLTYVIDPEHNLPKTVAAVKPLVQMHPSWTGTIGEQPPPPERLLASLETSDVFLFCGHGTGEKHLPGHDLASLKRCPAVFLMGCSSGVLQPQGEFEPTGAPMNWLVAGAPAVIGNLWDVTDGDLDLLTQALFNGWLSSEARPLPLALARARKVCKFRSLVGAAAVCYGVPIVASSCPDAGSTTSFPESLPDDSSLPIHRGTRVSRKSEPAAAPSATQSRPKEARRPIPTEDDESEEIKAAIQAISGLKFEDENSSEEEEEKSAKAPSKRAAGKKRTSKRSK